MNKQGQMQVLFLPWVHGYDEIQVGPVHLWPYNRLKREKIRDDGIVDALDGIFASFMDYQGRPLDVTVCTYEGYGFRKLKPPQELDVYRAVNAVAFTSICSTVHKRVTIGGSWRSEPCNADGFELHSRTFSFKDSHLVVKAPGLADIIDPDTARFSMPPVAAGSRWSPDATLIAGFDRMHHAKIKPESRERIHRAVEFALMGHMRSQRWSPETRIVMLATALETILRIGNVPNKSEKMAEELEKTIVKRSTLRFAKEARPTDKQKDSSRRGCMSLSPKDLLRACSPRNTGRVERTKLGWWGYDFYKLRNAAVHGVALGRDDLVCGETGFRHLEVATLILRNVLARDMLKLNLIRNKAKDLVRERLKLLKEVRSVKQFAREALAESERSMGLVDVYDKLGWLKE